MVRRALWVLKELSKLIFQFALGGLDFSCCQWMPARWKHTYCSNYIFHKKYSSCEIWDQTQNAWIFLECFTWREFHGPADVCVACCKSFSFPIIEIGRATYIRQSHWGNLYILKKPGYAHHLKRGSIYFTKTIIFQHCTDFNRSWSDLIRLWSSAELEDKYVATVTMLDIGVIVDNSQEPKPWHCYIRKHLTLHQQVLHFSWYAPFALAA